MDKQAKRQRDKRAENKRRKMRAANADPSQTTALTIRHLGTPEVAEVLQEQRELIATANASRTGETGQNPVRQQQPVQPMPEQDDQAALAARVVQKKVCEENRRILVGEAERRKAEAQVRAGPDPGARRSARIQGRAPEHGATAPIVPTPEQVEATNRREAKRVQALEDARKARAAAAVVAQNAKCSVCHSMHNPKTILLCDTRGCTRGRHLKCCEPPLTRIPPGFWFCGCVVQTLLAPAPEQQEQAPPQELGPGPQPGVGQTPDGDVLAPVGETLGEGLGMQPQPDEEEDPEWSAPTTTIG
jgi:hypothetical protein